MLPNSERHTIELGLLQINQNLRNHWSGYILQLMGFVIVANAAIWSLFIQSFNNDDEVGISVGINFILSAGLSSLTLGIWRWYSKSLDKEIENIAANVLQKICIALNQDAIYIIEVTSDSKQTERIAK